MATQAELLKKYFIIEQLKEQQPVIEAPKYKYPIILQPEPATDIVIRITPYKSDYCLN